MCRQSAMALKVPWVATLCISTGPRGGPGQGCLEGWLPEYTGPPAGAAAGPEGVPTASPRQSLCVNTTHPVSGLHGQETLCRHPRAALPLFLLPPAPRRSESEGSDGRGDVEGWSGAER